MLELRYSYSAWADVDTSVRVLKIPSASGGVIRSIRFSLEDIAGGASEVTYYLHDNRSDNTHGDVASETSYRVSMSDTQAFEIHNTDKGIALVSVAALPAIGFNPPLDPLLAVTIDDSTDDSSYLGEVHVALDAGTARLRVVLGIEVGAGCE
jgi:hypothetical protein